MNARRDLPHAAPFILLDQVEHLEEGRRGTGSKAISGTEPYVDENGLMPACLVVEAMAQLSGIVSGKRGGGFLSAVRDVSFHRPVGAGDVLRVESRLESSFGGLYYFRAEARIVEDQVAEGTIILQLPDTPSEG